MIRVGEIAIRAPRKGLTLIDHAIAEWLGSGPAPATGLLNLFILHTSASLLVQENADLSARRDLEDFFDRLAPEGEPWHRHLDEGPDDTTAHMRAAVLPTSLTVPIRAGALAMGTWQGVYLMEHRAATRARTIRMTLMGD